MASEIKVDTIVNAGGDNDTGIDLATNDQILLKVANATKLTMNSTGQTTIVGEGGTTTTNLQQGLVKVWVNFDGTASGAASRDSFNVSGMTDSGTGLYDVSINNNMANDDYADVMGMKDNDYGNRSFLGKQSNSTKTTSNIRTASYKGDPNGYQDNEEVRALAAGDLA